MKQIIALVALTLAAPAAAQEAEEPATPTSVIAQASAEEWLPIAPDDLLVMDLAPDARGNPRRVVIQLIPPPFSQPWVANIRVLARAHWWDGTSVNRVQDNYVTQWGDVTEAKPLPEGVVAPPSIVEAPIAQGRAERFSPPFGAVARTPYSVVVPDPNLNTPLALWMQETHPEDLGEQDSPFGDAYGSYYNFAGGFPINMHRINLSGLPSPFPEAWPIHCYGYVGVGRNVAPDTGTGAELYTIIGTPQRHMDRNLAVVGRVIEGMEHLSSLPRGHGELGFYTEEESHLRVPILSVRLGSDIENAPSFEYLDTASESFARLVQVRANRNDAFYTVPAGGVDICSVQVPVRRVGG
jgi:peptidylprolyl isomerase